MASFDHRQDGMKPGELNEAVGIVRRTLELESRELDFSPGFVTDPFCHLRSVPSLLRLSFAPFFPCVYVSSCLFFF